MFFTGTLQEGIAAAIQQTKSLVCFVTDDNTESQQWETEFLNDEVISPLIESSAVVLKLVAGSTEEGYLAQLFPVPKKPTVVVMKGGQLREYIAAGVTKEEFVRRLGAVLGAEKQAAAPTASTTTSDPASVQESSQSEQGQEQASSSAPTPAELARQPSAEQTTSSVTISTDTSVSHQPSTSTTTITEATASSSPSSATTTTTAPMTNTNTTHQAQIQAILAERAARLAAQKKQQEEAACAAARARAAAEDPNSPARQAADALRKKQQEAREERQRILRAIEDDKAARKARQLEKQREREVSVEASSTEKGKGKAEGEGSLPFAPASPMLPRGNQPVQTTGHCALQVRLTDGSTIRSRFSAEKDTVREVREWVEATVSDSVVKKGRYTFKVLLTPQPSRRIEKKEETKTLGELGLAPSSTLILVPTPTGGRVSFAGAGAAARGDEEEGNIFQQLIEFLVAFLNTVVAFFSTLFSVSGPPIASNTPEQVAAEVRGEQQQHRAERASGRSLGGGAAVHRATGGSRIKGLGDTRRDEEERKRNEQQFYNGNSTNFEPRHDEN